VVDAREGFRLSDRGIAAGAPADLVLVEGHPAPDETAEHVIVRIFRHGYDAGRPSADAGPRRRWSPCP
jgi:hypothetical protein